MSARAVTENPARPIDLVLTREQLKVRAEEEAQAVLQVSSDEAFRMLDRGELSGTMAEAEFSMLRHLLDGR